MRYLIGVDLGTTNSCVAYVDTDPARNPSLGIQQFKIPQFTTGFRISSLPVLPSCCYLPAEGEFGADSILMPWQKTSSMIVGSLALELGAKIPTRFVHSAKSWLCHPAANRRDPILPLEADHSRRISPVEATACYLRHLKDAWNYVMAAQDPSAEWEEQEIILTVPASFDEASRALTVEAARLAGYANLTLLEEPQAAFYSWISQHEQTWQSQFQGGERILVCDVGGGTTDFSLIDVHEKEGVLSLQRMAVGDHLLLGGDNIDIAIAHHLEQSLQAQGCSELSASQWSQLRHEARKIKERIWEDPNPYHFFLQGKGSSVVQGGLGLEVSPAAIQSLILQGFFDSYQWNEALQIKKASGFRSLGLPYEEEPSISKQIAHFLKRHHNGRSAPDYLLFNGGTLKPASLQQALVHNLEQWFPEKKIQVLNSLSLDLAVARGAAYYGKVRRGLGVRIQGGTPRSYYLEIEVPEKDEKQAMTILPRGCEEGESYTLDETFWAKPNTPVSFRLLNSHVRLHDKMKDLIPIPSEELSPLPPIHTVLRFGKGLLDSQTDKIPVRLKINITAIGTLELWLQSQTTTHEWLLEFQLRGQELAPQTLRTDENFDRQFLLQAEQVIADAYRGQKSKPQEILAKLEQIFERPRAEWSPSILRGLWPELIKQAPYRKVSVEHEARWWNLAGFLLRPGFGFPLDDQRIKDLWKILLGDLKTQKHPNCLVQLWICYRRIAGGLNKGQQMQLATDMIPSILPKKGTRFTIKGSQELYLYSEKIRALAAMELIDTPLKIQLGNALVDRITQNEANPCDYWALSRIGARHLLCKSLACTIPTTTCSEWVQKLLSTPHLHPDHQDFLFTQLTRKTDHRELNLPTPLIERVSHQYPHLKPLITNPNPPLNQEQIYGDQLPVGLSL